jgi:hypothetical protein
MKPENKKKLAPLFFIEGLIVIATFILLTIFKNVEIQRLIWVTAFVFVIISIFGVNISPKEYWQNFGIIQCNCVALK